jgi:hypothetical protein
MTAVVLEAYSGPEALRVEQLPVPKPGADEVLVKVAASPINPSDLAFLEGRYGFKHPPPVTPVEKARGRWSPWVLAPWAAISWGSGWPVCGVVPGSAYGLKCARLG